MAKLLSGVRKTSDQVESYSQWWDDHNKMAMTAQGPLVVAIGDSMSVGIGASSPDRGYLGVVRDQLEASDGRPWRMINLGSWGDRINDGIERQLPALSMIEKPDIVLVCIGSNDMVWGLRVNHLIAGMRTIMEAIPSGSHVAVLIGTSPRNIVANRGLLRHAKELNHKTLNPWFKWTGNQAEDRFHPNDAGYRVMATAFCKSIGIEAPAEELVS